MFLTSICYFRQISYGSECAVAPVTGGVKRKKQQQQPKTREIRSKGKKKRLAAAVDRDKGDNGDGDFVTSTQAGGDGGKNVFRGFESSSSSDEEFSREGGKKAVEDPPSSDTLGSDVSVEQEPAKVDDVDAPSGEDEDDMQGSTGSDHPMGKVSASTLSRLREFECSQEGEDVACEAPTQIMKQGENKKGEDEHPSQPRVGLPAVVVATLAEGGVSLSASSVRPMFSNSDDDNDASE